MGLLKGLFCEGKFKLSISGNTTVSFLQLLLYHLAFSFCLVLLSRAASSL